MFSCNGIFLAVCFTESACPREIQLEGLELAFDVHRTLVRLGCKLWMDKQLYTRPAEPSVNGLDRYLIMLCNRHPRDPHRRCLHDHESRH